MGSRRPCSVQLVGRRLLAAARSKRGLRRGPRLGVAPLGRRLPQDVAPPGRRPPQDAGTASDPAFLSPALSAQLRRVSVITPCVARPLVRCRLRGVFKSAPAPRDADTVKRSRADPVSGDREETCAPARGNSPWRRGVSAGGGGRARSAWRRSLAEEGRVGPTAASDSPPGHEGQPGPPGHREGSSPSVEQAGERQGGVSFGAFCHHTGESQASL